MLTLWSHNEPETLAVGRAIGALLRPGDVVAIDGPLGAGKTRLVRGIALGMGLDASVVTSPTYVMVNEYVRPEDADVASGSPDSARPPHPRRLFHVDAYRLAGAEDLDTLGWDRVMSPESDGAVVIEWAERIAAGEGGLMSLLEQAIRDPHRLGPEPGLCRVRMEPVGPVIEVDHAGPGGGEPEDDAVHGLRRIQIEPPAVWSRRSPEQSRDLLRLGPLLTEPQETGTAPPAGVHTPRVPRLPPLPRGWVRCATTGRPVPPDAPTFPFADSRARLADLGRWMSGAYTISREIRDEDQGDVDLQQGLHPH